jgi:uncharacterized protein YndB with AHSA1/START domain
MTPNNAVGNRHGSAVITLPSDNEILVTRDFDASASLVFKAYTTPEYVKRWWGFDTAEWLVCDIDLRVGGKWRYVVRERDMEVAFHGEYREINAPQRLVSTEVYEGAPVPNPDDSATVNILTLDEHDGVTTLTVVVQCPDRQTRDAIIESGMERGLQVSYNRLEDLVSSTRR